MTLADTGMVQTHPPVRPSHPRISPTTSGQRARDAVQEIPRLMEAAEREGAFRFPRRGSIVRPQKNPTEWRANVTQIRTADGAARDGTDAEQWSAGEIEGRRQIREYLRFLRSRVPGFERAYALDIATQDGIRETRRVVGEYALSAGDVLACASFADTIGVNGWPLERHLAGDVEWSWPAIPGSRGFDHLPYRMLVPQAIDNLLVAGRCASMTSEGQCAARVSRRAGAWGSISIIPARRSARRPCPLFSIPSLRPRNMAQDWGCPSVYDIIRRHQGGISVESAPGKGVTFTVWLPMTPVRENGGAP